MTALNWSSAWSQAEAGRWTFRGAPQSHLGLRRRPDGFVFLTIDQFNIPLFLRFHIDGHPQL